MKYRLMEITNNTSDPNGARIIIECNGFEIDIRSDEDGIIVDINKDGVEVSSASADFEA